jgi:PII-like signaling protein
VAGVIPRDAKLLRVFLGERDKSGGQPTYEAIVRLARAEGLAGATVLRGIEGFGHSSRVHTAKILRLSDDLPVVVEIVDAAEKIDGFLPKLDPLMNGGLVTVERAEVRVYGGAEPHGGEAPDAAKRDRS